MTNVEIPKSTTVPEGTRKVYAYYFEERQIKDVTAFVEDKSLDLYRDIAVAHFQQEEPGSCVDRWGVVWQGLTPYAYYFEIVDDIWEEALGDMGEYLDEQENSDLPEKIRQGFAEIYKAAYKETFGEEV